MKKTKFLALILAVSLMIMGASYAAWSDQISLRNTVNTGHVDVHFAADEGTGVSILDGAPYASGTVNYSQSNEDQAGNNTWDVATVTLNSMFPGAKAQVVLKMVNESTMRVKLEWTNLSSLHADGNIVTQNQFNQLFNLTYKAEIFDSNNNKVGDYNAPALEIEPNNYVLLTYTLTAKDGIAEDSQYTFNVAPVFKQYNR